MKGKGKQFRKHVRIVTKIPITVKVTKTAQDGKREEFYFTKDLSLGGVFLKTDQEIPVGTVITMEFSIQGIKDLVKTKGKVVRIGYKEGKLEGIGVQFEEIEENSEKGLKGYLKEGDKD